MQSLLELRRCKLGDRYLVQTSGIPIGGPVSGATLEPVLCVSEDAFDKFGWARLAKTVHVQGERHLWLTIVRYVDDVFVASRWFCPSCVSFIMSVFYDRPVTFDPANDGKGSINGYNIVRFLDLRCFQNWSEFSFSSSPKMIFLPSMALLLQKQRSVSQFRRGIGNY